MKMKKRRKTFLCLAVSLSMFLMAGCQNTTEQGALQSDVSVRNSEQDTEIMNWFSEEKFQFDYEIPKSRSYLLIDQSGYLPKATKKVIAMSIFHEQTFQIVSKESNEVVFEGHFQNTRQTLQTGETLFVGDFSEVTTPGTYEVRTKYLGTSYPFEIGEDLYERPLSSLLDELEGMDYTKDLRESFLVLNNLMLSRELHSQAFSKEMNEKCLKIVRKGIDVLLTYEDHQTGAFYEQPVTQEIPEKENGEYAAVFSGVVARFCYLLKETDPVTATSYLPYAELSYQHLMKNIHHAGVKPEYLFFSASELYRLTGKATYQNEVLKLLQRQEFETEFVQVDNLPGSGSDSARKETTDDVNTEEASKEAMQDIEEASPFFQNIG